MQLQMKNQSTDIKCLSPVITDHVTEDIGRALEMLTDESDVDRGSVKHQVYTDTTGSPMAFKSLIDWDVQGHQDRQGTEKRTVCALSEK